jgi:ribosomal protein S18 acetylase RimI-like enzyme
MNDDYTVRRAHPTLAEAANVLAAERDSLHDSPYDPAEVLQVMSLPEHFVYVACGKGDVVGFCSCFETLAVSGDSSRVRLEVDLLGIVPEHRGHGLASRLIACCLEEGRRRGIRLFRALVATDNLASQGAFRRAGMGTLATDHEMLLYVLQGNDPVPYLPAEWELESEQCSPRRTVGGDRPAPVALRYTLRTRHSSVAQAVCLQVQTLSYRGLWLEEIDADSVESRRLMGRAVVEQAKRLDLDEVGHLVPCGGVGADVTRESLLREGYQSAGRYLLLSRQE